MITPPILEQLNMSLKVYLRRDLAVFEYYALGMPLSEQLVDDFHLPAARILRDVRLEVLRRVESISTRPIKLGDLLRERAGM